MPTYPPTPYSPPYGGQFVGPTKTPPEVASAGGINPQLLAMLLEALSGMAPQTATQGDRLSATGREAERGGASLTPIQQAQLQSLAGREAKGPGTNWLGEGMAGIRGIAEDLGTPTFAEILQALSPSFPQGASQGDRLASTAREAERGGASLTPLQQAQLQSLASREAKGPDTNWLSDLGSSISSSPVGQYFGEGMAGIRQKGEELGSPTVNDILQALDLQPGPDADFMTRGSDQPEDFKNSVISGLLLKEARRAERGEDFTGNTQEPAVPPEGWGEMISGILSSIDAPYNAIDSWLRGLMSDGGAEDEATRAALLEALAPLMMPESMLGGAGGQNSLAMSAFGPSGPSMMESTPQSVSFGQLPAMPAPVQERMPEQLQLDAVRQEFARSAPTAPTEQELGGVQLGNVLAGAGRGGLVGQQVGPPAGQYSGLAQTLLGAGLGAVSGLGGGLQARQGMLDRFAEADRAYHADMADVMNKTGGAEYASREAIRQAETRNLERKQAWMVADLERRHPQILHASKDGFITQTIDPKSGEMKITTHDLSTPLDKLEQYSRAQYMLSGGKGGGGGSSDETASEGILGRILTELTYNGGVGLLFGQGEGGDDLRQEAQAHMNAASENVLLQDNKTADRAKVGQFSTWAIGRALSDPAFFAQRLSDPAFVAQLVQISPTAAKFLLPRPTGQSAGQTSPSEALPIGTP